MISQKSLTGHAKGGAAAWQVGGICDVFASDIVPGNQSLVSVDPDVAPAPLVVDYESVQRAEPVKAALISSLGFGHVSSVVALAHPGVFTAAMSAETAQDYRDRADRRHDDGRRAQTSARYGGDPALRRRRKRGFPEETAREAETSLLLDPEQRIGTEATS